MPIYEYVAINPAGKKAKGTVDAENVRAARQRLRAQGIFTTEIKEGMVAAESRSRDITRYFQSTRVALKDLAISTRQLATLLGAGLPLVGALQALADQTESKVLASILVKVRESVEEGAALAKALAAYPKAFPRLYTNLVAAGEASGTLDSVLQNLADHLESQMELKRKVTAALTYPILMLFICLLVISGLLVFVVPSIVEIFQKQNLVLPLPTRIVLALSNLVTGYWYVMILLVIIALLLARWYYRQEDGRKKVDGVLLKLPIFGKLYVKVATARVGRTLSTLLSSGVELLTALEITKNIVANVHVVSTLERAREGVREGRSLAAELNKSGIFPVMFCHMIAVGEKSGELENMLSRSAKAYESDVNSALSGLTALLEPLMMIMVGAIVLFIVISVLLPMADMIGKVHR